PPLPSPEGLTLPGRNADSGTQPAEVCTVKGRKIIFWQCPDCQANIDANFEHVGLTITCPACRKPVVVPNPLTSNASCNQVPNRPGVSHRPRRKTATLAAFGLVLLLIVSAVAGLLTWRPWAAKADLKNADVKFLPNDCQAVGSLDFQELLASRT